MPSLLFGGIQIEKINYRQIIDEVSSSIGDYLDNYLNKNAKFDRTFKAKIIGKISDGRYEISYRGKTFAASCDAQLSTNQIVIVCAPQNNWSELFIQTVNNTSSSGGVAGVSGVKGSGETSYRTGNVNITPANLGLGNVENKSSSTILSELTSQNISSALGYTPLNESDSNYIDILNNRHKHENQSILNTITSAFIDKWNFAFTHISDKNNPHGVTKNDVGLGNADNTSDSEKNVLSATKLSTPRNINGVPFDGTSDIEVADNIIYLTQDEYDALITNDAIDENQLYMVTDDEVKNTFVNLAGIYTLSFENGKLYAYYPDDEVNPFYFDDVTKKLHYNFPE
ncbi:hypothetical protein GPL15_20370 [Clostridium sp. MCC353]|uniref:hypothetical protein n=1 Tax=Clostridium sp. MCC353 TaxID=2592646 RepID=UPI001C0247ED|nr:hypothetical protein [Clostridium sp. MCC353]MBT9778838.1 hypothetical protein [Clostridium sp. MCC353]